MPFKSLKSNSFRDVEKKCLWCHADLILNNTRDIERKKFCSHSHRMKWRYSNGEFWHLDEMRKRANTPEANKKKGLPGDKHPRWKGDRKKVKRPITSFEGKIWRKAVYEKDDYTCQICGERGGILQADHIKPYCLYPELRFDINNGRTLCIECHKQTDTYGWKMINILKERGLSDVTI